VQFDRESKNAATPRRRTRKCHRGLSVFENERTDSPRQPYLSVDPGLLNETLIGAARRVAKTFLLCAGPLDASLKDSFEKLATAPRSGDWYEALDALRSLNEPKVPLPADGDSPQAIAQQLTSLVWRYTFSNYYWLTEARSKQQNNR